MKWSSFCCRCCLLMLSSLSAKKWSNWVVFLLCEEVVLKCSGFPEELNQSKSRKQKLRLPLTLTSPLSVSLNPHSFVLKSLDWTLTLMSLSLTTRLSTGLLLRGEVLQPMGWWGPRLVRNESFNKWDLSLALKCSKFVVVCCKGGENAWLMLCFVFLLPVLVLNIPFSDFALWSISWSFRVCLANKNSNSNNSYSTYAAFWEYFCWSSCMSLSKVFFSSTTSWYFLFA